jgi:hypothetical protein
MNSTPSSLRRRSLLQGSVVAPLAAALCPSTAAMAQAAPPPRVPLDGRLPFLSAGDPNIGRAFRIACGDLRSNVVPWPAVTELPIPLPAKKWQALSERAVELAGSRDVISTRPSFLIAGLDYGMYSCDTMMHAWDGASFFYPGAVAGALVATLLAGQRSGLEPDYWITGFGWTLGAWEHYLCTGDRALLKVALAATLAGFARFEEEEFDPEKNLFRGASIFCDGISGYPDFWVKDTAGIGHIRKWPDYHPGQKAAKGQRLPMFTLSTNCVNYQAYLVASRMQRELGLPVDAALGTKAARLKDAINRNFWREDDGLYRYIVDPFGGSDQQEGFGHAFAVLFGIASPEQARRIFDNLHITPQGIPINWPVYPRYASGDGKAFGNHNATIWPPVSGVWAETAARNGRVKLFGLELKQSADRACRDNQFAEVYHPLTGEIYGGIQEGRTMRGGTMMRAFLAARLGGAGNATPETFAKLFPDVEGKKGINLWQACGRNTFASTAFLRMVLRGLCGIRLDAGGVSFHPTIPDGMGPITLYDLSYRQAVLQIRVAGTGQSVKKMTINGREAKTVPATATGEQSVAIEMAP